MDFSSLPSSTHPSNQLFMPQTELGNCELDTLRLLLERHTRSKIGDVAAKWPEISGFFNSSNFYSHEAVRRDEEVKMPRYFTWPYEPACPNTACSPLSNGSDSGGSGGGLTNGVLAANMYNNKVEPPPPAVNPGQTVVAESVRIGMGEQQGFLYGESFKYVPLSTSSNRLTFTAVPTRPPSTQVLGGMLRLMSRHEPSGGEGGTPSQRSQNQCDPVAAQQILCPLEENHEKIAAGKSEQAMGLLLDGGAQLPPQQQQSHQVAKRLNGSPFLAVSSKHSDQALDETTQAALNSIVRTAFHAPQPVNSASSLASSPGPASQQSTAAVNIQHYSAISGSNVAGPRGVIETAQLRLLGASTTNNNHFSSSNGEGGVQLSQSENSKQHNFPAQLQRPPFLGCYESPLMARIAPPNVRISPTSSSVTLLNDSLAHSQAPSYSLPRFELRETMESFLAGAGSGSVVDQPLKIPHLQQSDSAAGTTLTGGFVGSESIPVAQRLLGGLDGGGGISQNQMAWQRRLQQSISNLQPNPYGESRRPKMIAPPELLPKRPVTLLVAPTIAVNPPLLTWPPTSGMNLTSSLLAAGALNYSSSAAHCTLDPSSLSYSGGSYVYKSPNFCLKELAEWDADDVVAWLLTVARVHRIPCEGINMLGFAYVNGEALTVMNEQDFTRCDPRYGSIFYEELLKLVRHEDATPTMMAGACPMPELCPPLVGSATTAHPDGNDFASLLVERPSLLSPIDAEPRIFPNPHSRQMLNSQLSGTAAPAAMAPNSSSAKHNTTASQLGRMSSGGGVEAPKRERLVLPRLPFYFASKQQHSPPPQRAVLQQVMLPAQHLSLLRQPAQSKGTYLGSGQLSLQRPTPRLSILDQAGDASRLGPFQALPVWRLTSPSPPLLSADCGDMPNEVDPLLSTSTCTTEAPARHIISLATKLDIIRERNSGKSYPNLVAQFNLPRTTIQYIVRSKGKLLGKAKSLEASAARTQDDGITDPSSRKLKQTRLKQLHDGKEVQRAKRLSKLTGTSNLTSTANNSQPLKSHLNKAACLLKGKCMFWEMILDALNDPVTCPSVVRWEDPAEGVFRIVDPVSIARLWGIKKGRVDLTWLQLYRSISKQKQILLPASPAASPSSGTFVYKFGPGASAPTSRWYLGWSLFQQQRMPIGTDSSPKVQHSSEESTTALNKEKISLGGEEQSPPVSLVVDEISEASK